MAIQKNLLPANILFQYLLQTPDYRSYRNYFASEKQKIRVNYLFLFMLIAGCTSCSKDHRDKEIKADLTTKAKNELNFAAVNYTVEDGIVTLTGKCSSEKSKSEAEQAVKGINIVKGIINKIIVAPVILNADLPLKQAVDSVLKNFGRQRRKKRA